MATYMRHALLLTVVTAAALILSSCGNGISNAPAGRAHADDPMGDVRPASENELPRHPAVVDLRAADITSDGKTLTIQLTSEGTIPHDWPISNPSSDGQITQLVFGIMLFTPDGGGFSIPMGLTKDGWQGLAPADEGKRLSDLDRPRVSGNVITFKIPLGETTRLADGFTWAAYAICSFGDEENETYGDRLPGAFTGSDVGDEALPFPG
jgi:hypothetical protein